MFQKRWDQHSTAEDLSHLRVIHFRQAAGNIRPALKNVQRAVLASLSIQGEIGIIGIPIFQGVPHFRR